jgi:hypothetical protein
MSVREQYVRDRDAYLQKKDEEAVIADQLVEKQLAEKKARGEQTAPQVASDKYCLIVRFDPTDREHKEIALLHPTRLHNSEESGKMLRFRLPREADPIIENRIQRQGNPGPGIFPCGAPWPDSLNLPPATIEDALVKKIATVFELGKQSLQNSDPRKVIAATMESLRKLQTLDGKFPQPLTEKSLHGILGDFVKIAHPTVVACREMLLYEMLPLIGVVLGDSYYVPYGSDRHYSSIFTLGIGRTSDGKGQGWHACQDAIELVDPGWLSHNVHSNPSSGEGLIRMLGGQLKMEGGHKKRVAIFNTEMVTSFIAQGRKDSSLGGFLRKAYDGDPLENFRSEGKKSTTADNYVLGFCGTITPKELQQCMPMMDWSNGAQNRFLWSIGFKDKNLGRSTERPNFISWGLRVQKLIALNQSVQPTPLSYAKSGQDSWDLWFNSLPEHDDTILAESQARIAANCARVANIYAQLDERRLEGWNIQLEARHVEAAIEIVNRSRQSVEWYLSQQMGSAQKVSYDDVQKLKMAMLKKARAQGVAEMTATEVYELFTHKTTEERDLICLEAGFKVSTKKKTARGKAAIVWIED